VTNLPDIGHLAKWSVSSHKFGFGAECLRDDDPETFWQYVINLLFAPLHQIEMASLLYSSDGPQPHFITVQFGKKVAIQVYDPTSFIFVRLTSSAPAHIVRKLLFI
jgi:anaphase-promoting complex subunit 10